MNRYSVKITFVLSNRIYDKGEVLCILLKQNISFRLWRSLSLSVFLSLADSITFTREILNGKLHVCAVYDESFPLLKNNPKENITILASFKISSINSFFNFSVCLKQFRLCTLKPVRLFLVQGQRRLYQDRVCKFKSTLAVSLLIYIMRIYFFCLKQIHRTVTKRVKSISITIAPLDSLFIIHYTLLFHYVFVFQFYPSLWIYQDISQV